MKPVAMVVGIVLALAGTVFFFQGIGVLHGSAMTGETLWAVIGPVLAVAGVALVAFGLRQGRASSGQQQ